ncbi:MAG: arylsulfotransferase family protein [PVC group bacterium]
MKKLLMTVLVSAILGGSFWYLFLRPAEKRTDNNLRNLRALPYISVSSHPADTSLTGVTVHIPEKAFEGYNLYTDEKHAYLIDMEGQAVQRWDFPTDNPEWEHVEYLGKGEILANCNGEQIVKLDRDSKVIWSRPYQVHHDIAVDANGTILVPIGTDPRLYRSRLVQFDSILRLSGQGEIEGEWSSFSSFDRLRRLHRPLKLDTEPDITGISSALKRFYFRRIRGLSARVHEIDKWFRAIVGLDKYDYYHLNTVEVLPETGLGKRDPRFAAGNILTCLRHVDMILILDRESGEIAWSWGPGILDWPHMPTLLDNGTILVYDNGAHRTYSRVLELDPVSGEIVWEYRGDPPEAFYSKTRGSNQRLPNGNTLICESERGRVFEVTPSGDVVWEFYPPDIRDGRRRLIYRMERIPPEKVENWLNVKK